MNEIIDSTRSQVLILANPKAGFGTGRSKLQQLVQSLQDLQLRPVVLANPKELTEALKSDELNRCVVAAGGDGTAELVANLTPPEMPIATLPMGTENLLAKFLKLRSPSDVADAIGRLETVKMDAGEITKPDGSKILFLIMLSCGFDAEVIRRLDEVRSGNIHHLSYFKPILDSIRSYEYPKLQVYCRDEITGQDVHLESYWVFAFNIPSYAAGIPILPSANPQDGMLDVSVFQGGSFWHGLMHLSAVVLGQQQTLDGYHQLKTRKLRIESAESVPFQLDGEAGGFLPIEISILPNRLTYIVGKRWQQPGNVRRQESGIGGN